jgi:chromosome segregation protein
MFDFRRLELVHWDYWQRFTLPLDASIITVVGPNGSGKTTLLDALRTLLTIDCAGNRDFKQYLRHNGRPYAWLRAVIGNPFDPKGGRLFFPLMDHDVTLACRIQKKGGEWQRQFVVAGGDVPIEELERRNDFIGLREYRARLEAAGLSQAIRRVLSLEQGATDKLCQLPPKALLDLVFDVFGDKAVLDDYQHARAEQHEAERERQSLEVQLSGLGLSLQETEARVRAFEEWQALQAESQRLQTETLAVAELAEQRDGLSHGRAAMTGLQRRRQDAGEQLQTLRDTHARLDDEFADANRIAAQSQSSLQSAEQALAAARDAHSRNDVIVQQHQRLLAQLEQQADTDLGALATRLDGDRQRFAALGQREYALREELRELEARQAAWQSGRRFQPEFELAFRKALDEAGIGYRMLSEIVEVTVPGWQAAVEASLAGYRHVVLLENPDDRRQAWEIGEQLKYRHFVVAERQDAPAPTRGSLLEVVRFDAAAPDWLIRQLDRIQRVDSVAAGAALAREQDWITPDGYFRERRGGRHLGVDDFYFGRAAREAQLRRAGERLADLQAEQQRLRDQRSHLAAAIAEAEARLRGVQAADQLSARADEFALAEAQRGELETGLQHAADAYAAARQAARNADEVLSGYRERRGRLDNAIERAEQQYADADRQHSQLRRERVARILDYRQRRQKIPPAWRSPERLSAVREQFESPQAVRREIERVQRRLDEGHWETDPACVALRDKLGADHGSLKHDLDQRQRHLERARQLTEDARGAYLNVLRATVRSYARNLRFLAELAGIGVEVEQPEIANDDLALAQIGLTVRFEFDKKGFIGLDDGEASGGQQVMKSLLLLVALMRDEQRPGGFVFIDEPFAHLDIFNIDKVGAFLKSTRAQYVLTTPNTHNVNVFQPSELTLVTSKRRPGSAWAQPVAVLRRAPAGAVGDTASRSTAEPA